MTNSPARVPHSANAQRGSSPLGGNSGQPKANSRLARLLFRQATQQRVTDFSYPYEVAVLPHAALRARTATDRRTCPAESCALPFPKINDVSHAVLSVADTTENNNGSFCDVGRAFRQERKNVHG